MKQKRISAKCQIIIHASSVLSTAAVFLPQLQRKLTIPGHSIGIGTVLAMLCMMVGIETIGECYRRNPLAVMSRCFVFITVWQYWNCRLSVAEQYRLLAALVLLLITEALLWFAALIFSGAEERLLQRMQAAK